MPDYNNLVNKIAAQTGTKFRIASKAELAELRSLRLPDPVVSFFAQHEPSECVEGQVRLWPIAYILSENRDMTPGAYVAPLGYIVFATTFCGDAYCFDINVRSEQHDPRIVLISHEVVREGITAAEAKGLAKPVAKNLYEFLQKFESMDLDEDCIYRPGPPDTEPGDTPDRQGV